MIHLPTPPEQPLVLFTDLDGTLLDHHTYSAAEARDALYQLEGRSVPVVFCSSKTFAEQIHLQQELGITQPFIFENGSAVAVPKGYFRVLPAHRSIPLFPETEGIDTHDLHVFAHAGATAIRAELAHFHNIKGFFNATDTELSAATGLAGEALKRARDRQFTETILTPLVDTDVVFFKKKLAEKGWILSRGGRFFTIQSAQVDKGKAVQWLKEVFRQNLSVATLFAATGDSLNDAPMLTAVDLPFLVQRYDGTWTDVSVSGIKKIEGIGPAGFSAAVKMLLSE